jgi:two-component sensor histidine kinase
VTERRRASEYREIMVRELHHRVKNTLATVQAIASTSARTAVDLEAFSDAFSDRIVSLSRTHTLLREQSWERIDLKQLVAGELAAYEEGGRVALDGAELQLPSGLGMTLGMTVHELTTNAVKHGALSDAHGRIAVRWRLEERDGAARLLFNWTESGGPSVGRPIHRGFGSQLLEKMLARQFDASVRQTWDPTGLRVDIDAAFGA